MEDVKDTKDSIPSEDADMDICPCCGKRSIPKPAKINTDLMDQWLACMVTATPFSHEYPMYGGRVKITVTRVDNAKRDTMQRVVTLLNTLRAKDWGERKPVVDIAELNALIQVLIALSKVEVISGGTTNLFKPQQVVLDACDSILEHESDIASFSRIDDWSGVLSACYDNMQNPALVSGVPLVMLSAAAKAHSELYNLLISNGFDKDFWQGIELA